MYREFIFERVTGDNICKRWHLIMQSKMLNTIIALLVLASLPIVSHAQSEGLTRAQVQKTTGLSAALSLVTITTTGFLDSTQVSDVSLPGWFYGAIAMEHLPLYALDPVQGIKYSAMQAGKKFGMQTLNDSLYQLYVQRQVTLEECLRVTSDQNEFKRMVGAPVQAAG